MGSKYTRVRDKTTGHEYDVLTHRVDEDKHELADQERWPPSAQPRAPRNNVKGPRPRNSGGRNTKPAEDAQQQPDTAADSANTTKPPRKRPPRPSKTNPAS